MRHMAKYNGRRWSSLGSGTNGHVYSLALQDTLLFVGGYFDTVGTVGCTGLGQLNLNGKTPVPVLNRTPSGNLSDAKFSLIGSRIVFTNAAPGDEVRVYTAKGALLRHYKGVSSIDLGTVARGLLIIQIRRKDNVLTAKKLMW